MGTLVTSVDLVKLWKGAFFGSWNHGKPVTFGRQFLIITFLCTVPMYFLTGVISKLSCDPSGSILMQRSCVRGNSLGREDTSIQSMAQVRLRSDMKPTTIPFTKSAAFPARPVAIV